MTRVKPTTSWNERTIPTTIWEAPREMSPITWDEATFTWDSTSLTWDTAFT